MEVTRFTETDEIPRWSLQTPVQIYIRDDLPHLAGHTIDISMEGVQIEVGVKLPIRSVVVLEIYFQRTNVFDFIDQTPLRIRGQVIWRKPMSEDDYDSWSIGLRFLEINEAQKQTILDEVKLMEALV